MELMVGNQNHTNNMLLGDRYSPYYYNSASPLREIDVMNGLAALFIGSAELSIHGRVPILRKLYDIDGGTGFDALSYLVAYSVGTGLYSVNMAQIFGNNVGSA